MKILLVSSYLPYPLFSGGHVRLYNLIKLLSKRHEITLVCEKRTHQTAGDVAEIAKFCRVFCVPRKKQWSLKNILKTGFSTMPFLMVGHTNKDLANTLKNVLAENNFDLIHAETFYIAHNLPESSYPHVLVEHNIEYLVYEKYARRKGILFPLLYRDVLKMKHWEEKFWQKADAVVAVSEEEKAVILGKNKHTFLVPNGVDLKEFTFKNKKEEVEKRILFIGDFKWVQNRDSLNWILREVWPKIKSSLAEDDLKKTKLWVVGQNIPSVFYQKEDKNIIFDTGQKSAPRIFSESDILLAPVRVAGGTSFKILEAMATGVVVVTTNLGARGIGTRDNREILLGENADEMTKHVVRLLSDQKYHKMIATNARKLIEENFAWDKIVEDLEKVYEFVREGKQDA